MRSVYFGFVGYRFFDLKYFWAVLLPTIFNAAFHLTGFDTRPFLKIDFRDFRVRHEPRLVPCWTMLIIGSLSAMWARWPSGDLDSLRTIWVRHECMHIAWTKPEGLVLYITCRWFHCRSEGGQAEAGGHSASNLSLTLKPYVARMLDGPTGPCKGHITLWS